MSERSKFIEIAKSHFGCSESEIKKLWKEKCGRTDWDGYFCAEFVSICIAESGLQNKMKIDNYSRSMYESYKFSGSIKKSDPEAGDLFFVGNSDGVNHVGIVASQTDIHGNFIVIEADGTPQKVITSTYNVNDSRIYGFTNVLDSDIIYAKASRLSRGDSGDSVKSLQMLLNLWMGSSKQLKVDGDFGYNTYNRVKAYQKKRMDQGSVYITVADGICGYETWSDLIN